MGDPVPHLRLVFTSLLPLTVAALLLASGCGDDASSSGASPTELVVLVDTDLPVPGVIDAVRLEATAPGGAERVVLLALAGEDADTLPGSLALQHAGGPLGPVRVKAVALHGNTVVVTRDVEVSFVEGRTMSFTVHLLAACVGMQCDQGQTCGDDGCRAVSIATDELGEYGGIPTALESVEGNPEDFGLDPVPDAGMPGELNTSCSDDPCDPLSVCTPLAEGGRECGACPSGYDGDGDSGCTDIDECASDNGGCDDAVVCRNNVGAPASCGACPIGYDDAGGDGSSCVDIDECSTANGGCGPSDRWTCTDNDGAFPTCADIDECATDNGGCDAVFETCENNVGAAPTCVDIDECATDNGGCDAVFETCTDNVAAAPSCADIDECADDNGGCDAVFETCTDNVAAAPSCADIDECASDNGGCDAVYELCADNVGAVPTCTDVDECASNNGGCDAVYETCADNVLGDPTCTDIDECAVNNGGCDAVFETCADNVLGDPTCTDIDECAVDNGGCDVNASCTNELSAAPTCACMAGYEDDLNGGCMDTDECAADPCAVGQRCLNVDGSFFCTAVTRITGGTEHSCGLLADGRVRCFGTNNQRQLGLGLDQGFSMSSPSKDVVGISTAVEVVSGERHSCARLEDSSVLCWGQNNYGQIGTGATGADVDTPTAVQGLTGPAIGLAAGSYHTCALIDDGTVECWGRNNQGQLGDDTTLTRPAAVQALGFPTSCAYSNGMQSCMTVYSGPTTLLGGRAIAAGHEHTCVLGSTVTNVGTGQPENDEDLVRCWGNGGSYRLGSGDGNQRRAAAQPLDGVTNTPGQRDVESFAVGSEAGCVRNDLGEVRCWGQNWRGQLGSPPGVNTSEPDAIPVPGLSGIVDLQMGYNHACVLTDDQRALCWGRNNQGQLADGLEIFDGFTAMPVAITGLGRIFAIHVGRESMHALAEDGRHYGWGRNSGELLGVGHGTIISTPQRIGRLRDAVSHSAGELFTCAVDADGLASCWGRNSELQVTGQNPNYRGAPADRMDIGPVQKIATGLNHACALLEDQSVHCWGDNTWGKVSALAGSPVSLPTPAVGVSGPVVDIAAGREFTCVVIDDGSVQCWGRNEAGQFGDPDPAEFGSSGVAVTVPGIDTAVSISAGRRHACVVLASERVACWGVSQFGESGSVVPAGPHAQAPMTLLLDRVEQVAAFSDATCADVGAGSLSFNEGVYCWGRNNRGQLGNGPGSGGAVPTLNGVVAARLSLGGGGGTVEHMCAVLGDGSLQCWGKNDRGQLGNDSNLDSDVPVDVLQLPAEVEEVSTGQSHTCASLADGTTMCWGRNDQRQIGDGTNTDRWTPVGINSLF